MAVLVPFLEKFETAVPYLDFYGRLVWVIDNGGEIIEIVVAAKEGDHNGIRTSAYRAMRNIALSRGKFARLTPYPLWIGFNDREHFDGIAIWGVTVFSGNLTQDMGWFERLQRWFDGLLK